MTSSEKFTASMFGMPSASKISFLRNEVDRIAKKFTNTYGDISGKISSTYNTMIERLREKQDRIFNTNKLREIRDYLQDNGSVIDGDFLHRINPRNYYPNSTTKEFILHHPKVYKMRSLGILNNFNDEISIDDRIPNPEFTKPYIQTYNGVVRESNGEKYYHLYEHDYDIPEEDIRDVQLRLEIWDLVSSMLNDGLDPTEEMRRV